MMLLIPLTARTGGAFAETLVKLSVKGLAVVLLALVSAPLAGAQVLYARWPARAAASFFS